jgi:hypothetical protein
MGRCTAGLPFGIRHHGDGSARISIVLKVLQCSMSSSLRSVQVSLSFPASTYLPVKGCETAMLIDYVLGAIVTLVIMVYP